VKIVVDRNIRGAEATFGRHGNLEFMDGRAIDRRSLREADVLIIRTATRVDEALLAGTPVGFVGTTSIGTDHLDTAWLNLAGIPWANAPGCNADSAAEYTLATSWLACKRLGRKLEGARVGIIGRGNVGSRVQRLMQAVGATTLSNDPPLADQGETGLAELDDALSCDIVCLHVPLTRSGPYPTSQLMDAARLAQIPSGALLVNTARGDVVDGPALLAALKSGQCHAALDVWPGEPLIEPELLDRTVVATPHVAGYSTDGKYNGTCMVYRAFCEWANIRPEPPDESALPQPDPLTLTGADPIGQALEAATFVSHHDRALKALKSMRPEDITKGFDRLRRDYPPRRDFHAWRLHCRDPLASELLAGLGFHVNT
jgi:erythronate-4-phosphate dehydrogenase